MTVTPIIFDALDHHYYNVLKLVVVAAGIFAGIALAPTKRPGKLVDVIMYFPSVIAITAPSIVFAALDRSYDKVLVLLILAAMIIGAGLLPINRSTKPMVAIDEDVLTIRMRFYTPAKTEEISLRELHRVTISGPKGNRDWRFDFRDGSSKDFRPHLSRDMSEALVAILRKISAGRFKVSEVAPLYLEF